MTYEVTRSTDYCDYTALVTVDEHTRKQHIELYEGDPYPDWWCRLFDIKCTPITERTVSPYTSIDSTIYEMIAKHEITHHNQHIAETADEYIEIDYAAEMRKQRTRYQMDDEEEPAPNRDDPIINDWQEQIEQQRVASGQHVATNGKVMHINSLRNLPQYRKEG
jgi:hypothetical protein